MLLKNNHNWIYFIIILTMIIFSLFIWGKIREQENNLISQSLTKEVLRFQEAIKININSSVIALRRMAQRWEAEKGTPKDRWLKDAMHYVKDNIALTTVEWVDNTYHVRWIEPLKGNEKAVNLNIAFNEERKRALDGASVKNTLTITPPLDLIQGYKAFIVYIPIYYDNNFQGFIVGIYDIEKFLNKILASGLDKEIYFKITDGDKLVFETQNNSNINKNWKAPPHRIELFNRNWSILVNPTNNFIEQRGSFLAEIVLISGLILSILISLIINFAITIRKKSQDLAKEKERSELILKTVKEGIFGVNLKGETVFANPAALEMTGFTLKELKGKKQHDLIHHTYLDGSKYPIEDCSIYKSFTENIENFIDDEVFWRKDGSYFPVEYTASPLKNSYNKITGSVVIFRDVTEQKLAEKTLIEAKNEAEEHSRMKSDFLANMSHEIRTPMNGIIGMTNLLMYTDLSFQQKNYTQTVMSSAEALLDLINDILDFSKIEAGKLKLENLSFNLEQLVEEVADIISIKCNEKNVRLFIRYDPSAPCYVVADSGRIRQILLNLLSNAIKFTQEGHILINVEFISIKNDKLLFKFEVQDTGIGIPDDKQDLIFNKFDQADQSTARKFGGTGLGLAICKELVTMMGGEIGVESEINKGANFHFTILVDPNTDESSNLPEIEKLNLKNIKIMIIDDSKVELNIIKEQLKNLKMIVHISSSAKKSIDKIEKAAKLKKPYDIIIINEDSCDMKGVELGKYIKNHENLKNISMLFSSSKSNSKEKSEIEKIGFDGYIEKPIHPSELPKMLDLIIKSKKENQKIDLVTKYDVIEVKNLKEDLLNFNNAKILLAEDNIINQEVAISMLEKMGCVVKVANNGNEAVEIAKKENFNLIFMDCHMPEMDGYDATKIIKEHINTPVIAFTANVTKNDVTKCIHSGMDDYLPKPVKQEMIENILKKWLGRQGY